MISPVLVKKETTHSEYLGEDIVNLLNKTFVIPEDFGCRTFRVTKEYIARPDLISLDAYGDTMFADVICKINGISNPFELNEGMTLVLPNSDDIIGFSVEPSQSELKDEGEGEDEIVPVPKQKSTKRAANEAVIGDSRFKFDPNLGIIIY